MSPLEGSPRVPSRLRTVTQLLLLGVSWCAALPSLAATYFLPPPSSPQVVGQDQHIKSHYQDTLYDLAQKYGVGSDEIIRANPHVDPWLPGEGTDILIPGRLILPPGPRSGIVVNVPGHRLYYYPPRRRHQRRIVITYPVSIGSMDWTTPVGVTRIIQKIRNPPWYPPASIRKEHRQEGDPLPKVVPPGPKDPLGDYAMRMDIRPGDYLIHGTNLPIAVGMPVTHGCIRLYPEDIKALFAMVPVGTKVYLLNDPVKVAVVGNQVLVEAHPQVDAKGRPIKPDVGKLLPLFSKALRGSTASIDWDAARKALQVANGVLVPVGVKTEPAAEHVAAGSPRDGAACATDLLCADTDKASQDRHTRRKRG